MGRILVRLLHKTAIVLSLFSCFSGSQAQEINNITAQAWVIADEHGQIILGNNTNEIRSIASITKLMTAMVVLDSGQELNQVISKKIFGVNLTRRQLIELAIVKSDNQAAYTLCEFYVNGLKGCIEAMNNKAKELGMENTQFTDPTGLHHTNVSTAEDLIKMVRAASYYYAIQEDSNKKVVVWKFSKNRVITFGNTNPMAGNVEFKVSKTGWISKAGGCIVMMVETHLGPRTIIVLGSQSIATRIPEAKVILSKI